MKAIQKTILYFILITLNINVYSQSNWRLQNNKYTTHWHKANLNNINIIADSILLNKNGKHFSQIIQATNNKIKLYSPFRIIPDEPIIIFNNSVQFSESNKYFNQKSLNQKPDNILFLGENIDKFQTQLTKVIWSLHWDKYFSRVTNKKIKDFNALKTAFIDYQTYGWTNNNLELEKIQKSLYLEYKLIFHFLNTQNVGPLQQQVFLSTLKYNSIEDALSQVFNIEYVIIKKYLLNFYNTTFKNQSDTTINETPFIYKNHNFHFNTRNKNKKLKYIQEPLHYINTYNYEYPIILEYDSTKIELIHPFKGNLYYFNYSIKHRRPKLNYKIPLKHKDVEIISYSQEDIIYQVGQYKNSPEYFQINKRSRKVSKISSINNSQSNTLNALRNVPIDTVRYANLDYFHPIEKQFDSSKLQISTTIKSQKINMELLDGKFEYDVITSEFLNQYQPIQNQMGNINLPMLSATTFYEVADFEENQSIKLAYRLPLNLKGSEYYLFINNRKNNIDWGISFLRRSRENEQNNDTFWMKDNSSIPQFSKLISYNLALHHKIPINNHSIITNTLSIINHITYFPSIEQYSHLFNAIKNYDIIENLRYEYYLNKDRDLNYFPSHFSFVANVDFIASIPKFKQIGAGIDIKFLYTKRIFNQHILKIASHIGSSITQNSIIYRFIESNNNAVHNYNNKAKLPYNKELYYQKLVNQFRGHHSNENFGSSFHLFNIDYFSPTLQQILGKKSGINFVDNIRFSLFYDNLTYINLSNQLFFKHAIGAGIEFKLSDKTIGCSLAMPIQEKSAPLLNIYIK